MSAETFLHLNKDVTPAKLVVYTESGTPKQYRLDNTVELISTPDTPSSDENLILDYPFLDSLQGTLKHHLTHWSYLNRSANTATFLNGRPLAIEEDAALQNGDVLRIEHDKTLIMIFLEHYIEDAEWKTIPLNQKEQIIHIRCTETADGQDQADVDTDASAMTDPTALSNAEGTQPTACTQISSADQHHAQMRFTDGHWEVDDLCTRRGVYVNQEKVNGSKVLSCLDAICIGDTLFLYQEHQLVFNHKTLDQNKLIIHIEERSVRELFKKHVLLKDINLSIDPGDMVLLLGGSGAGKTTFVNAVTGYEKAKAQILENGHDVYQDYSRLKYDIGFVPQQDLLREDDTVRMTLVNAAQMRMPENISSEDRAKRVEEILNMFGLDPQKEELVAKLSGGQRKRLSIGVEFIANPSLFFLDEPDSGLDGVMARALMENLRQIADQKKIVLVITHTPDRVIDLFDKVIVLAKSTEDHVGHLAFYGSIENARSFFQRDTMEEIVKAVNNKDEGGEGLSDQFIEKYKEQQQKAQEAENNANSN